MSGGAEAIRVLVLTDSEDTAELLVALLGAQDGLAAQRRPAAGGAALAAATRHRPDVAVLADLLEDPAAIVAALDAAVPEMAKVAILPHGDTPAVQACSLAGATITLFKPFDQHVLTAAVRQAHARVRRQRGADGAEPQPARHQRPRVVAVHGVKGGVGATTIAVNLAAALHQLTRRRVAVVDTDLLSGDAGVLLDLPPERSLADLLPELGDLDAESVDGYFLEHSSGVHVLVAPEQIERAEAIGPEDLARVLAGLRPYFDYQVVDTASRLAPATLAVLDEADLAVVVLTPELVALRNAARLLRLAAQLGYPLDKLMLVINRGDTSRLIDRAVIEEQLRRPVTVTVPSDGHALLDAMNAGELLAETRPASGVSESIRRLAREVAGRFGWDPAAAASIAGAADAPPLPRAGNAGDAPRANGHRPSAGTRLARALRLRRAEQPLQESA